MSLIWLQSLVLQYVNSISNRTPVSSFAVCEVLTLIGPLSLAFQYVTSITDRAAVSSFAVC